MKKIVFILFFSIALYAFSSDYYLSEKTDINSARFEIIQSPLARKYTIKIDKETGETWQMVSDSKKKICWQKLQKGVTIEFDKKYADQNNYIIFMGGMTAKDMFLLNVNTGATWQLVYDDKDGVNWWMPLHSD